MSKKVSGKRFSEHVKTTFTKVDDFLNAMRGLGSFRRRVEEELDRAKEFLRSKDLPVDPVLGRSKSTGEWHPLSELDVADVGPALELDKFVLDVAGIARDRPEHLAARFVVHAADMKLDDREQALEAAYQLGVVTVLSRIYGTESLEGAKRGSANKRKPWADALAERLVADGVFNAGSIDELIPESQVPFELDEDHHFYIDGQKIVCEDPVGKKEIGNMTLENFKKRYFRPLLQKDGQQRR